MKILWLVPISVLFLYHHTAAHSLSQGGLKDRIEIVKVQELMCYNNDSVLCKAKPVSTTVANKELIQYFPSSGRCSAAITLNIPLAEYGIIWLVISLWSV